jgi:queuosine precursor transporter
VTPPGQPAHAGGLRALFPIVVYVACELIANVTAAKPVGVAGISAPGGVFIYALTFTLLDVINELLGRDGARKVVLAAFAANVLLALYTQLIVALPSPSFYDGGEAFARVFGATPRIVLASLAAYLLSTLLDVEVFAWWKRRMRSGAWARVLMSNTLSTAVDSVVFVVIAFAGVLPLLPLIAGQYLIKMAVTVLSIPLLYTVRSARTR